MKTPLIERILNRLFHCRNIVNCFKNIYLRRWYLFRTAPISIMLHKFERSDEDRALHDHPWPFLVIPIWRGYIEHHECDQCQRFNEIINKGKRESAISRCLEPTFTRVLPILGTRFRPATYRHRVELLTKSTPLIQPFDSRNVVWDSIPAHEIIGGPKEIYSDPRIELPAWSIFIRFRKVRNWGYWLPSGFQLHNEWWKENCE